MPTSKVVTRADRRSATWAVLLCFFASGMSGLVYQVVWVRELVLVFGATTFAVSTVLTAFMGGLALGSFYFGRRSERITRPLRLYGLLEIGIGIYGLSVPLIFSTLPNLYHPLWQWLHLSFFALSIIRFLFASLVLIVPTALMGATLPVLSSYYAHDARRIGLRVGLLYALNTFGAVIGAAATGFFLIPTFGMRVTTAVAAAINILLGLVALSVARTEPVLSQSRLDEIAEGREGAKTKKRFRAWLFVLLRGFRRAESRSFQDEAQSIASNQSAPQPRRAGIITVLVGFAISGFVALSYEVIWSRVLALIIGSSVYAFSIMLTTFLIGLAAGASIASRFVDRVRRPFAAFGLVEIGVGVTSLVGAYLFNDLPYIFVQLYRWVGSSSFEFLLLTRFLVASMVMIMPTLLLGALFPLVVKIVSSERGRASGRTVGDAYAANTVGAIAGSFASGFILIPWLGLLGSLRLCAALNFIVAAAMFVVSRNTVHQAQRRKKAEAQKKSHRDALPRQRVTRWAGIAVSAVFVVVTVLVEPPWDSEVMSSAVYRYAPSMTSLSRKELFDFLKSGQGETVFYEEGITATVAVQQQGGGRVLKVNGKPEASTAGDMPTQILIGSLPLLVRERTDDVLMVGLGSGVTLGSIEQFPASRITCVELEPAVIEATRHFEDVNNRPLEDPRLRMISNDGRNYIYTTDEKFDVIVSQPSNPWLTGAASLFTLEYFERGAAALKDDGIFSQWLQIYEMSPEDVRSLIATFRAAFPCVYLFRGAEGDLMLLGSKTNRRLDLSIINSHFENAKIAADLKRINTASATDIISRFYLGPEEVTILSQGAPLNTDDNALIEFNAPRHVGTAEETVEANRKQLLALAASPLPYLDNVSSYVSLLPSDVRDPHREPAKGRSAPTLPGSTRGNADLLIEAALGAVKRDDKDRAHQLISYSLDITETAQAHSMLGELNLARGNEAAAIEEWKAALALDPDHFYTLVNLGKMHLTKQDIAGATSYLDRAIKIEPKSARARHLRGLAYQAAGDHLRAALEYRKALEDKQYADSIPNFYLNFGTALVQIGYYDEARQLLEEFVKRAPNDFDGHYQLGAVYEMLAGQKLDDALARRAVEELKLALSIKPGHARAHYYLSKAYRHLEMYDEAEAEFALYERLAP